MRKLLLCAALVAAGSMSSALAGDYSSTRGYGTVPTGGVASQRWIDHGNAGFVAGQEQDASNGNLTSRVTSNTNIAVGNWTQVDIVGNGNNVNVGSDNSGDVTAGQTNGGGNVTIRR
ncbi:MAG: hypothetical protein EON60_08235 [Alphaproteobacteria bacterium]|nr:MAG: hypothetical protein EON60_08235 [Alphaproteobacteria bacterium]